MSFLKQQLMSFLWRLAILVTIIAGVATVLYSTIIKDYYLDIFPFLLVFIAGVTAFFHYRLLLSGENRFNVFTTRFMGFTVIKLFLYLAFIIIYLFVNKEHAINFVLVFFILYLIFTVFEISKLLTTFHKFDRQIKKEEHKLVG